jgi:hypothetical protein
MREESGASGNDTSGGAGGRLRSAVDRFQGHVTLRMKATSKAAKAVLDKLTEGLDAGQSRTIDNAPGVYMAVHVEHLDSACAAGAVFSVTHYFEQNGDLVPDPDMTFLRGLDKDWFPLTYQNQFAYRVGAEIEDGQIVRVDAREQADQTAFASVWMRNIREQQGL